MDGVFNEGAESLLDGTADFLGGTIKARLVISTVTPNKDDDSMTGYTAVTGSTDVTLAGKTMAKDDATDRVKFDCDDPVFTGLTANGETIGHMVVYLDGANDAARIPLFAHAVNSPVPTGSQTIQINAAGLAYLQQ